MKILMGIGWGKVDRFLFKKCVEDCLCCLVAYSTRFSNSHLGGFEKEGSIDNLMAIRTGIIVAVQLGCKVCLVMATWGVLRAVVN